MICPTDSLKKKKVHPKTLTKDHPGMHTLAKHKENKIQMLKQADKHQ